MRIVIGQMSCKLGDIDYNREKHMGILKKSLSLKGDITVFPELSLTGYSLNDIVSDVYLHKDDDFFNEFINVSKKPFIVGGVERGDDDFLYNSAFFISEDQRLTHRKMYLPTYGMFDEERFFKQGNKYTTFELNGIKCGIAICEDMWHMSVPYVYALKGVKVLFAVAASPGKGIGSDDLPLNAKRWQGMLYVYSMLLGMYIVFVNRSGVEEGVSFWGGSAVYSPGGNKVIEAKYYDEDIIFYDIDENEIVNYRIKAPFMKNENIELVKRELERILNED